ncbi:MAG: hypothetical protein PVG99_00930 [Desulfobacteraceae bacterium]|jgi:F-type H+-transporting ATPase subunit b
MLKIDFTLIIQIANFLFLLFILNILLYRPIRKILTRRREEMDSYEGMIGDFQNKSAQYTKELEESVAWARREGAKEKETLKSDGLEEEKGMLGEATSEAAGKIEQARDEISRTLVDARQSLENELAVFSKELAEKILGRSV